MTDGRGPGALVVAQVAISLVLLVGAGVLARSFLYLMRSEPGFEPSGVLTVKVPLPSQRYADAADAMRIHDAVRRGVAGLPGVEAVGGVNALPLTRGTSQTGVGFPTSPRNTGDEVDQLLVDSFTATPGYFDALRVPILSGRGFREGDDAQGVPVAIVDRNVAEHFFPGEEVVGKRLVIFTEERTVVGVVDQPRLYDIHQDDRGQVFVPLAQRPSFTTNLAIHTTRDPAALAPEVIRLVRSIDPDQPLAEVRTMDDIVAESLNGERLSLTLIGSFALGALLLSTLGLYGVVSNTVTSRTREMGVRMALGADGMRVRVLVLRRGMALVLIGTLLGLAGALATARFLESLLVGVSPADPATVATAALVLAAVALVACYLPARRAASIDPLVALRQE